MLGECEVRDQLRGRDQRRLDGVELRQDQLRDEYGVGLDGFCPRSRVERESVC